MADVPLTGILGGSGLYEIPEMEIEEEAWLDTPFGDPSDAFVLGRLKGQPVAFLARHARGHRVPPGHLNYRANIFGFKKLGAQALISVNAVGSMREEIHPTDIVIPDQFFDFTRKRESTFFARDPAVHVDMADPVCPALCKLLLETGQGLGANMHMGGTYINIEGPAFSTRGESRIFRSWGVDVIGMTAATEARLAREAELCYASLSIVTDYDVWKETEEDVSVEILVQNLAKCADTAKRIITAVITEVPGMSGCSCDDSLASAIITDPKYITLHTRRELQPLLGKYLPPDEGGQP